AGRARRGARGAARSAPSVHARAGPFGPGLRVRAGIAAADPRLAAEPGQPAVRLPVPPAVRVRRGRLPDVADAAAAAAGRAVHRLPALRTHPGGRRGRSGPPVNAMNAVTAMTASTGAEPLLSAREVSVSFPVGSRAAARFRGEEHLLRAVDGVDLEMRRGEALALVGESGSGKSTLAQALAGLQPTDRGEIRFDGLALPGGPAVHRDGLPGSLLLAEPSDDRGRDAARDAAGAPRGTREPGREVQRGTARAGRAQRGRPVRVPAPVLRRPAAAGGDRPGPRAA